MAALSGAAVGGTVGGLTGALVGFGIPELEARKYEGKVKSGNSLISIKSNDSRDTQRAKEFFVRAGATDITFAGQIADSGSDRVSTTDVPYISERRPAASSPPRM